eukprot:3844721-Pyramimonas_sp.AAC.1
MAEAEATQRRAQQAAKVGSGWDTAGGKETASPPGGWGAAAAAPAEVRMDIPKDHLESASAVAAAAAWPAGEVRGQFSDWFGPREYALVNPPLGFDRGNRLLSTL